jgi:surfeit locus 1 family protein
LRSPSRSRSNRTWFLLDPRAADGYERKWQPALRISPARHLAYAVQWFAFGVVAVVVLVVTSLRRGRGQDGERK